MAPWLCTLLPPHRCYTEAFGGAAGLLLRKPRSAQEVYNDLDGEIVHFFRVLRAPRLAERLVRALHLTPYAREEFEASYACSDGMDAVERARRCAVRAMMGFGSAGATKAVTGMSTHADRCRAWANYPRKLQYAVQRLQGVIIECKDALRVISTFDAPDTLHFIGPPYLPQTRSISAAPYRCEMDEERHVQLLVHLQEIQGMCIVCGHSSALYDEYLKGWQSLRRKVNICGQKGGAQRIGQVWLNARASRNMAAQQPLFADHGRGQA